MNNTHWNKHSMQFWKFLNDVVQFGFNEIMFGDFKSSL